MGCTLMWWFASLAVWSLVFRGSRDCGVGYVDVVVRLQLTGFKGF